MNKAASVSLFIRLFTGCITVVTATAQTDTLLPEVRINAYESQRPQRLTPAPVALLNQQALARFDNNSLLPAMNTLAGVRMEERSPGSYRLSFRGSLLRSPFGVRNVKIYLDDFPLTDPGGGTYLNLIDLQGLEQATVIKGPASSLYGAGTGGALLLKSRQPAPDLRAAGAGVTMGGFGLRNAQAWLLSGNRSAAHRIQYGFTQTEGYREQSAMQRHSLVAQTHLFSSEKSRWHLLGLFTDLRYETPGGLTQTQAETDPRQARPATAFLPGAEEQQAAVHNRAGMLGVANETGLKGNWLLKTLVYTRLNQFSNAAIRNYEQRFEMQGGLRTSAAWLVEKSNWSSKLSFGVEAQTGQAVVAVSANNGGSTGALLTDDRVGLLTGFGFIQEDVTLNEVWVMQCGVSFNSNRLRYQRLFPDTAGNVFQRAFAPVFAPRLALLRALGNGWSLYFQTAKGFSAPTVEELLPSTGVFNSNLSAEYGWNTELGVRYFSPDRRWQAEFNAYLFRLKDAIVLRRDEDGAEFFENAGSTKQDGLEAVFQGVIIQKNRFSLHGLASGAWQPYTFDTYRQGTEDYSGNKLTGVPPLTGTVAADISYGAGWYANLTHTYTGVLPLNDANSTFAPPANLLMARLGFRKTLRNVIMEFFGGGNNLLQANYSSGYDLNAAGGRYFNPSATRYFYAGIRFVPGFR